MSAPFSAFVGAVAVEMRDPLSRIELSAGQLARECDTPAGRALAAGVSEAVADLDRLIGRLLGAVAPSTASGAAEDLRPHIAALRERLAPALAARDIRWELSEVTEPVLGEPLLFRAVCTNALRVGAELAGAAGCLQLELVQDVARYGVRLTCRRPEATAAASPDAPTDSAVEAVLSELHVLLTARGGGLAARRSPELSVVDVWLPRAAQVPDVSPPEASPAGEPEASCAAS